MTAPVHQTAPAGAVAPIGILLREWRAARRLSQLALALEAGTSARHLSYVETGKSQPSRALLTRLADALAIPLRDRNALLLAAGIAPMHAERPLEASEFAAVRRAIDLILAHQEPYPAFVLTPRWDIVRVNRAAERVARLLCGGSRHTNMLRQFFDPHDLRAAVANWPAVAQDLVHHLRHRIALAPGDAEARALLAELFRYPDVPAAWKGTPAGAAASPLLAVEFRRDDRRLRFFSTMTTFVSPYDVTLDELRVECAFPADEATAACCRALATADAP